MTPQTIRKVAAMWLSFAAMVNMDASSATELPPGYEAHWEDLISNQARHEDYISQFGDISAEAAIKRYLDTHLFQCNDSVLAVAVIRIGQEAHAAIAQFRDMKIGGWNADPLEVFAAGMGGLPRDQAAALFDNLRMSRAGGDPVIFAADQAEIAEEAAINGVQGYATTFPKYAFWRIKLVSPEIGGWSDWVPMGSRVRDLYSPIGTLALIKVNGTWTGAADKTVRLKENSGNFNGSVWETIEDHSKVDMSALCAEISEGR